MNTDKNQHTPRVVIVALNYNQYALTRDMLESLRKNRFENTQVILVDNHSSDGSAAKLRQEFPEAEIHEPGKNLGCAGGRNYGAKVALEKDADYVFFVDNDMFVAEDCIPRMVKHMERNPNIGIIGPRVMCHPETEEIWALGTTIDWDTCEYVSVQAYPAEIPADGLIESAWIPGGASMIRASVFCDVGLIDERFFIYFEDTDFSFRIRNRGMRVAIDPEAVLWHRQRSSIGADTPQSAYYFTRNRILFFMTYSPRPLVSWWFFTSRALLWSFRLMVKNEWRVAGAVIAGLKDATLGRWGERIA